ncbi:protein white-like isoform X2 [Daphnia pulex]|uniref:protein white-like isoform X2 n=1 Tax=Daphnia pulex TaxID=6669 RepID=UPI001EDF8CFF|nr:protein white-like isoform X2 [Daphnia pulex]
MDDICNARSYINLGFDNDLVDNLKSSKQGDLLKGNVERDTEIVFGGSRPTTYCWKNVEVQLEVNQSHCFNGMARVQKKILKSVTGCLKPGEFLAIMGASGAGKTTLLNCLTFRNARKLKINGERYLNGAEVNTDILARISGFVQQDDLFIPTLTVKEHLQFQALLRMDKHLSYEERMNRVDNVILELGLSQCINTVIGLPERDLKSISGGERKRLAFASEVLTNPSLIFCDEPTSGLDSFMAHNVVQILKNFALSGKSVICTIHQPSSEVFSLFDRILLMAEGRTAFLGPAGDALPFFSNLGFPCPPNYNPADFFIHTLATQGMESIFKSNCYVDSTDGVNRENLTLGIKENKSPYKASWMMQFRAVFWRSVISLLRESAIMRVKAFETIFITAIVAIIFQGQTIEFANVRNIQGVLFICVSNTTYQYVFGVITAISGELPIFLREHHNGMYRTDVYFLSKTLADLPVYICFPFVFVAITYYAIGLNPSPDRFLIACGIVILVANAATSFGYLISCATGSTQLAIDLTNSLLVPILHMGGYFLRSGSVPIYLEWMRYFSWYMYGLEALSINQWSGVSFNDPACPDGICTGAQILRNFDFNPDFFYRDICGLCGLIVGFRILGFFALLVKISRSKNK